MMASIDEDVEKSSLADQDDVGSGVSSKNQIAEKERSERARCDSPNMIGVTVGWSQGNTEMIGIIKTVHNRHLVMEDMKVQGELL
ncbi:hypothetical protein Tco_0227864, partial [Tanacetum coccineum]